MKILLLIIFSTTSCSLLNIGNTQPQKAQISDKANEEKLKSPDGKIEVIIHVEKKEGSEPSSYIGRLTLKPDSKVPAHVHGDADEYLSFEKGTGVITINEQIYEVKDGMSFFIPRGVTHSYLNNTRKTAKATQIYTPAGPEQRFKNWKSK